MIDLEKEQLAATLKGSLLEFIRTFYPLLTGREFIISNPIGRESHHITVCRALAQTFRLQLPTHRLNLNIEPGSGKSTFLSFWTAWCFAHYPDCRFIYISYSKDLATKHTETIRRIMQLSHYRYLFGVEIKSDSKAKAFFQTQSLGSVAAFGSDGSVTGQDGGLPGLDRFSGAVIVDDAHKPSEATSDTIRQSVIKNYDETIRQRTRGQNVPIIYIGQRVHENDLTDFLLGGNDVDEWTSIVLPSLDNAGNALYPEKMPKEKLLALKEKSPYVFWSQYQQQPIPAGGALFNPDWFVVLDDEPEILLTFITADTAETSKSYNDATVFSFWGVYEIENMGVKTGDMGLHWLDCVELRVEPKDLKDEFMTFWQGCARHSIPPMLAAIEKKSTGVTLVSVLQEIRGIHVRDIQRTASSGSKAQRFLEIQPLIASKFISFPNHGRHTKMCIDHMSKITTNDAHRWDDICDTASDAIKIALIDKTLNVNTKQQDKVAATILGKQKAQARARQILYGNQQDSW